MNCCTPRGGCSESASAIKRVSTFRPAVDVIDDESAFKIIADVPGASAENIDLDFEKNVLTVTARVPGRAGDSHSALIREYEVGDFRRSFRFDESIDPEGATASLAHGVLTVTLPKSAATRKRRVQVSAG